MTVLPQASGTAIARTPRMTGAFQRCDAEHHAGRLPHRHRDAAGLVGGNHFAGDLGGERGGFAQHLRRELHVELAPGRRRADLGDHRLGEILGPRAMRSAAALSSVRRSLRPGRRPGRECARRGFGGRNGVRDGGGRGLRRHLAGQRIETLEGAPVGGGQLPIADHQIHTQHTGFARPIRSAILQQSGFAVAPG